MKPWVIKVIAFALFVSIFVVEAFLLTYLIIISHPLTILTIGLGAGGAGIAFVIMFELIDSRSRRAR